MHDGVHLCQDPQTDFALTRGSFGAQQGEPHLPSAWAHDLGKEKRRKTFEIVLGSLERLFLAFTVDSQEQATLSAGQSGMG